MVEEHSKPYVQVAAQTLLPLGSRGNWLAMRLAEVLTFVMMLLLYWLKPPQGVEVALVAFLLMAIALVWDPVAHGVADANGIRYRHYFAWHTLPWGQVERVDWSSAWIVIVRKEGSLLRRRLVFPLQRSMGDALAEAAGRSLPEPRALTSLKEFLASRAIGVRTVERVRPKHVMVALAVFLLICIGVAWAWWAWLRP